ncbi:Putative transporting ATPase [Aequoribacter fuscus]|uniref:Putative transporting ATPase n=1 Tax=Aequoribacter fuscus TaxID=2518989 RepID=F3L651_9GAMM|nr:elongation factor P hydroxylase [Aequoribacter fuscus]EGG28188.1 Putative transporting ATPase [Aequoribacter fuscus]QHJ89452.1 ATPase [Aequoribacter fuscus]
MIAADIENVFNTGVGHCHDTVLRGGASEPFYQAPKAKDCLATIWYRADYLRSALHELAHWCVAGLARRQQDDYGYWYSPDGRSPEQQRAFFQVEARPQAIERLFCEALAIPFEVSVDNLNGVCADSDIKAFDAEVERLAAQLLEHGLSSRAQNLLDDLRALRIYGPRAVCNAC